MIENVYYNQAELLLRVIPFIEKESVFALKGGTAINFFVRDLPRISVDIDLVYLPVGERNLSLEAISSALVRISQDIESRIPETKVLLRKTRGSDLFSGLWVQRKGSTIKIEVNLIVRGSAYPPEKRPISPRAIDIFEISVESQILSENELYAGKICAALDRQHPRDLFDILMLFKYGHFNTAMRKAFIVYLISHDRPMVEILKPRFLDIRPVFETEFQGMTLEAVTCEDLEAGREELVSIITKELTVEEKQFIVSVKEASPRWDLLGIEGIEHLPAVKWKLLNIAKMNPSKYKKAVSKLRDCLEL